MSQLPQYIILGPHIIFTQHIKNIHINEEFYLIRLTGDTHPDNEIRINKDKKGYNKLTNLIFP